MLDLKLIRSNPEKARAGIKDRGGRYLPALEKVLELDGVHRAMLAETETMRSQRNEVSKKIQGFKIAKKQIQNGEAWKKLNQIIVAQGGKKEINSEEVMQEVERYEIHAQKNGKIVFVDNHEINEVCMNLGAPIDKYAGIHTHVRYGEKVKKGQKLFTMYASNNERLRLGVLSSDKNLIFHIK